jgi:hypothetical protein
MQIWQRSDKGSDLGTTLLVWRHRDVGRFISKIFSWLLGGFVLGLLTAILCDFFGIPNETGYARVLFFVVFIGGVIGAFFHNLVYGLHYRVTDKALLYVRPLFGIESAQESGLVRRPGDRIEYLPWEQIKSAEEAEGGLFLHMKDDKTVRLGVTPVVAVWLPTADGGMEKRTSAQGLWHRSAALDKETLKLVIQKIRDIKKSAAARP